MTIVGYYDDIFLSHHEWQHPERPERLQAVRRVLTESGEPIQGLYAIGNCSGALMGPGYPGPGSTLGPAMVMGYVAAGHIAGANAP